MIHSIVHPTDFSPEGERAFEHALHLALAYRAQLSILHVRHPSEKDEWQRFPRVREVLERWGVLKPGANPGDVLAITGVEVNKVEIRASSPGEGLSRFVETHRPDLVVMASRGKAGLDRSLNGSVSAEVIRETLVPTLIFGPAARSFIDPKTGAWIASSMLVPVDKDPAPDSALDLLDSLTDGLDLEFDLLHVGDDVPTIRSARNSQRPIRKLSGPVIETILAEARGASLVAMPTVGREGFWDMIHGSTTERVLNEVGCPVLALPIAD